MTSGTSGTCVGCGAETQRAGRTGPHPKRCADCNTEHQRAKARAATAKWRQAHPEKARASDKRWYAANAEAKRAASLAWYHANRERALANNAAWYAENVGHSRSKAKRRRAQKYGAGSERFLLAEIYERDGWVCQLCGLPVDPALAWPHPKSASLDHVIPLSKGGEHTRANVQLACLDCNVAKGARMPVAEPVP